MRKLTARVLVSAAFAAIAGCSTFSGEKLGVRGGEAVVPTGIPYTLVRPVYTLSQTAPPADKKPATYALDVTYELDPTQTFSLKISPSWFADPTFTMQLAAGGTLQATNAKFTDQLVPTITALGSLVANLIGASTMGVLDRYESSVREAVAIAIEANTTAACTGDSDVPRMPLPAGPASRSVRAAIVERIKDFTTDNELTSRFHYITVAEKTCLEGVRQAQAAKVEGAEAELESARNNHTKIYKDDAAFVERIARAAKERDADALATIDAEFADEIKKARAAGNKISPLQDSKDKLLGAAKTVLTIATQKVLPIIVAVVEMDARAWRARHLLYVEREIDEAQIFVLRSPGLTPAQTATMQTYVSLLQRQRAETIGAIELYERALTLSAFLQKVQDKSVEGGRAPATAEYSVARTELDLVLTQMEVRRAATIADAKPAATPPPPAFKPALVKRVKMDEIAASRATGWFEGAGAKAPAYVLVLEEAK